MPADRDEIVNFCNEYLGVYAFDDYGPQGMQFIGNPQVKRIASAVSVTTETILRAKFVNAQMLLVHHGMFWNTEPRTLHAAHKLRMDSLAEADISLLGYHLALDAHPEIGNNILTASAFGIENPEPFAGIGWGGKVVGPESLSDRILRMYPGTTPLVFSYGKMPVEKACVVTGSAGHLIHEAVRDGYDLLLTGEAEEPSKALAKELGIGFIAAGHHNTEKVGIQALGEKIAKEFEVEHMFVDAHNPV